MGRRAKRRTPPVPRKPNRGAKTRSVKASGTQRTRFAGMGHPDLAKSLSLRHPPILSHERRVLPEERARERLIDAQGFQGSDVLSALEQQPKPGLAAAFLVHICVCSLDNSSWNGPRCHTRKGRERPSSSFPNRKGNRESYLLLTSKMAQKSIASGAA